jgi:DNA modification methylase
MAEQTIEIRCSGTSAIPLSELQNFQRELKTLPKSAADKLKQSIIKYGFRVPVFVWENRLLDGHQRVTVLQEMQADGYSISPIPVVTLQAENEQDAKRLLLLINSRYGKFNQEGFEDFAAGFALTDFTEINLPELGFDFLVVDDPEKDDAIPEVPQEPTVKPGDLYKLGDHRLLCGDSLNEENIIRLLDGARSNMVFSDPPYNISYGQSKYGEYQNPRHKIRNMENDSQSPDEWRDFCNKLFVLIKQYNDGDIYLWGASGPEGMRMRLWLIEMGCHWSATIIWKKNNLVLSPAKYQRIYEPCFYGWFDKSSFCADRKQREVWEFDRPMRSDLHPTMKPVALCEEGIRNSSNPGDIVLDLFGGSGSTLIACEKLGRKCYMTEIDPGYCDVIIKRWETHTGKKAEKL